MVTRLPVIVQIRPVAIHMNERDRLTIGPGAGASAPLEVVIDLEADNVQLRAALARSATADVRRDLVTQELKHRIGNLLAVVQAVARHTFKKADAASLEIFIARLHALAAAQTVLIETESSATTVEKVVVSALAPHCRTGDRATISGPVVALDGRRAHALTLALHELATNASKYGALSLERGWIEVSWTTEDDLLNFLWREHEGPVVSAPTRTGFGSRLITRNLGLAFHTTVTLDFAKTGLECTFQSSLIAKPEGVEA